MNSESKEKPEKYQQALDCAEAGQYAEALASIQSYLTEAPDDAEALNDEGTILWCQGASEEALTYLKKAWALDCDSPAILWNLFEIHLSLGQGSEAIALFDELKRLDMLQMDMLNRAAAVLIDSGNLSDALSTLDRSLAMESRQELLHPIVEVLRKKQDACQTTVV